MTKHSLEETIVTAGRPGRPGVSEGKKFILKIISVNGRPGPLSIKLYVVLVVRNTKGEQ